MKVSTFNAKTRKKKFVNADEINAIKVAYGKPLEKKDYVRYALIPGLIVAGFSFILLYYWWVSLILGFVGALYGLKVLMPKNIQRAYEQISFRERNKFVNNMTQILTNDSNTLLNALGRASDRSEGELKKDLKVLQARLMGADHEQVLQAFKVLSNKYRDDIIFVQYLEQVETASLEGKTNVDTLKDIKTYHNEMKEKKEDYERKKDGQLKDMKMLCSVVVIFILIIAFSFSFDTYIQAFARHPIGWGTSGIYMLLMFFFFKSFATYYFDDSILEVKT
ncbi:MULTISPECIES: hypothetical protein [Bacillus]|uniref:hypothetical protein n=1 Tax=Bacillus TaxID=1386 RepID=UPI000279646B|nr:MULTISPECIES: hypothetical protein [Bacillus]EJQ72433.1 hypothetical protein IGK_05592 [Bacillus toyonensis]OWT48444.1 hypothetical protein CER22_25490 [Bacillus sp. K2I17]